MPKNQDDVVQEARALMATAFGTRFKGLVLYGSRALGDARPDSDLDLMVLLEGPIDLLKDLDATIRVLYPLQLHLDYAIHASPTDVRDFQEQGFAVYRNARREGILL